MIGLQFLLMVQPTLHAYLVLAKGGLLLTGAEQINRLIVLALFVSMVALFSRGLRAARPA